jgi:SAM-dependent methyltransferase
MQEVERALLRAFADAGLELKGSRVLDVGCGSGYFLHRLREYGAGECHGIHLMETRVAQGRTRYPGLEFHVGTATELPFGQGDFDLVTQFTCLSSILDDQIRLAVADEMRRVAAGGWLLSFDMRGMRPFRARRPPRAPGLTPTVPISGRELRRLFGEPAVLRREALVFDLGQLTGRHTLIEAALAAVPQLRSHLLGLWKVPARDV